MPRPHPPEFRERAVELARLKEMPVAQIAADLGISGSCLRGWMKQADIDEGRRADGVVDRRARGAGEAAPRAPRREARERNSQAGGRLLRRGERSPKMIYTFIAEQCSDLPISTCCRVLKVSTSGYYQRRKQPVTDTELAEAYAANEVHDIWTMSRHSYGSPRVRP